MASQSEQQRNRLPFEPVKKQKKSNSTTPTESSTPTEASENSSSNETDDHKAQAKLSAIPEAVSKRMVRRMAFFSGIPTSLGILSFFIFYWIVSNELVELPRYTVVFVSMGLFGLGVLGLSYGLISSSWDEKRVGSWFGWDEFTVNIRRIFSAWRSARRRAREE